MDPNTAPYNVSTPLSMGTTIVAGFEYNYSFDKSVVVDDQESTLTYSCTLSPDNGWLDG